MRISWPILDCNATFGIFVLTITTFAHMLQCFMLQCFLMARVTANGWQTMLLQHDDRPSSAEYSRCGMNWWEGDK